MSSQNSHEALVKATISVANLRHSFPCKAGKILNCTDEVIDAFRERNKEHFPFNLLLSEVDALAGIVRSEYDDLDLEVNRQDSAYELVLSLEHRFRLSLEFIATSKLFESVEKRYERIDKVLQVLPSRNYSLRELLLALSAQGVSSVTILRLESAINSFDREDYKSALRDCTEAGEAVFALYKGRMKGFGCDDIPREQGLALRCIRNWMLNPKNSDNETVSFAPSGRSEWFLLSMFETLHYLRNAVSHPSDTDDRLPEWQRQRRGRFPETLECARLGLNLVLRIVLEFQLLLDHQGFPV